MSCSSVRSNCAGELSANLWSSNPTHCRERLLLMKTPHLYLKGAGVLGAALLAQVAMCADYPTTISSFSPLAYWRFNETATSPSAQAFADSSSTGTSIGYAAGS